MCQFVVSTYPNVQYHPSRRRSVRDYSLNPVVTFQGTPSPVRKSTPSTRSEKVGLLSSAARFEAAPIAVTIDAIAFALTGTTHQVAHDATGHGTNSRTTPAITHNSGDNCAGSRTDCSPSLCLSAGREGSNHSDVMTSFLVLTHLCSTPIWASCCFAPSASGLISIGLLYGAHRTWGQGLQTYRKTASSTTMRSRSAATTIRP